jgi:hypothetical protein
MEEISSKMKTYLENHPSVKKIKSNQIISQSVFESLYEGVQEEGHVYTEPIQEKVNEIIGEAQKQLSELFDKGREPIFIIYSEFVKVLKEAQKPLDELMEMVFSLTQKFTVGLDEKLRVFIYLF